MAKRGADSYITDRNWDEEDEKEEPGSFTEASVDVLKSRPIKKAKRRGVTDGGDSVVATGAFSGFKGFANQQSAHNFNFGGKPQTDPTTSSFSSSLQTTTQSTSSQIKIAPFSVQSSTSKKSSPQKLTNGQSKPSSQKTKYLHQLKCLNEAVAKWIKEHVDSTPYCILTPIFTDYEKHLKEIEDKYSIHSSSSEPSIASPDRQPASKTEEKLDVSKTDVSENMPLPASGFSFKSATDQKSDSTPSGFSFSANSSTAATSSSTFSTFKFASGSLGDSKGAAQGFSFASKPAAGTTPFFAVSKPAASSEGGEQADEEYVPPKADVTEVKEDDAFYTKRCKLFFKRESSWVEKGVGNLHLKDCSGKTQLLVRADTSLGNILLNIMLSSSMPASRQGKNNVTIMCVPNPPLDEKKPDDKTPVGMLLRVKTGDDADELFDKIKEAKMK